MNKSLKIGLLITGALAVGTITVLSIRAISKKREQKRMEEEEKRLNKALLGKTSEDLSSTSDSLNNSSSCIVPKRNLNRDINNDLNLIKGLTLYPAQKSTNPEKGHDEGLGYAIIRSSAEVNNAEAWYDTKTNQIGKISGNTPIGKILTQKYDNHDPAHRWFGVALTTPIKICAGFSCVTTKYGWVRADVVTFKKYCP